MKYLLMGLLASIGWYLGKVFVAVIEEVMFSRLHDSKWYAILCKREKKDEKIKKSRIGF